MKVFYKRDLYKIKNPVVLYGVGGGMGNVAKLVARKLLNKFNKRKVAVIISESFSDLVHSNKEGIIKNLELALYHFKHKRRNFLVLYGLTQPNVQPFDIIERYKIIYYLLKTFRKINTKEIISLGGFGVEIEPRSPKIIISANNKKYLNNILKKIKDESIDIYKNSNIVGMSGLIVALSKYYKIDSAILLAETYPTMTINGYLGAAKLLDVLNKLYKFNIDTSDYIEKGKELREKILKDITYKTQQKIHKDKDDKRKLYYFG